MANKIYDKYLKMIPNDLTDEQLLELLNTIAQIEYNRRNDINQLQDWRDTVQNIIIYLLEKDKKGKKGLQYLKDNYSMLHFINILHLECRNDINYMIRKKSTSAILYRTDSLNEPVMKENNTKEGTSKSLIEVVAEFKELDSIEDELELDSILTYIESHSSTPEEFNGIVIKYYDDESKLKKVNFSYKEFTKLLNYNFNNKKIKNKDLIDSLEDEDGNPLSEEKVKKIMDKFKKYFSQYRNEILGGEL